MAKNSSTFSISLKLLVGDFKNALNNVKRQIQGLASFAKGAFALGSVVAFGKQMIQVSSDFEDAMARVQAVSNASVQGFRMMANEAKHLGETTKFTATEAANALENLTRNGLTAQQATNSLASVLKLAQANAIGLAESATILTNTMNMFGLTTKDTTDITDVLSATAANSATNITQLFEALVNAAPTARNLGISIKEVSAALGAMAQRGVKGAEAGTQLRMALTKMVDPKIVAKMQAMNIEISEQQIREEGLLRTIERLKNANLELGDLVAIFSQRGAQGMAQLINAYNDFDILSKVLNDSAGETNRMFEQGLGSTKKAALMLKSAYQQLLITVGEESRGPFNSILKFLADAVKNMYTWEGRIKNLAAVLLPLLSKAIIKCFVEATTSMKAAQTAALKFKAMITALKSTMGGLITVVATLASVVVTNLLMSLTRTNAEINRLHDDLEEVDKESTKLKGSVQNLINKLEGGGSLNDAVLEACRLFPDFKDRILEAARAAGDTTPYENLKTVLGEILELQNAVSANAVLTKLADAYTQKISEEMQKKFGDPVASRFYKAIEQAVGREGKGQIGAIYYAVADAIGRSNNLDEATKNVKSLLEKTGIEMDEALIRTVAQIQLSSDAAKNLHSTYEMMNKNQDLINEDEKKRLKIQEDTKKSEEEENKRKAAAAELAEKRKKAAEKLQSIDDTYNKELSNVQDDLKQGYITFEDYINKLASAAKKAYEDLRDATGAKGEDNKYYEARRNAESRKNNLAIVKSFKEAQKEANKNFKTPPKQSDKDKKEGKTPPKPSPERYGLVNYQEKLVERPHEQVEIPEVGMTFDEGMESFWKGFKTSGDAINSFTGALSNLSSAYDKLSDANSTWLDKLQAAGDILKNTEKMVDAVADAIELLGDRELAGIIKETMVGKVKRREAAKDVAANTAKAGSGAAASVASIPYVGPFLAGAALASIVALIMATVPKFEKGGFIKGNTKYGDRLLARVNAGEAILNSRQQRNFMDMANGKYNGGGQVEFHISGKDLRGVLRNIDSANSRISSKL